MAVIHSQGCRNLPDRQMFNDPVKDPQRPGKQSERKLCLSNLTGGAQQVAVCFEATIRGQSFGRFQKSKWSQEGTFDLRG